jgi:hypothetical protein
MNKLSIIAILAIMLISVSAVVVSATQYTTEKTTDVVLGSDGSFTGSESSVGITYDIQGTSGATGTVTADLYNGNPQAAAVVPDGITLTHFIAVTFNMNANEFGQAKIVIKYTDADVSGIQGSNYVVYKYMANSNTYIALPTAVDTTAKTLTVILTSVEDPTLAIGGTASTTTSSSGFPAYAWAILAISVVGIILLVVFLVTWMKRNSKK